MVRENPPGGRKPELTPQQKAVRELLEDELHSNKMINFEKKNVVLQISNSNEPFVTANLRISLFKQPNGSYFCRVHAQQEIFSRVFLFEFKKDGTIVTKIDEIGITPNPNLPKPKIYKVDSENILKNIGTILVARRNYRKKIKRINA